VVRDVPDHQPARLPRLTRRTGTGDGPPCLRPAATTAEASSAARGRSGARASDHVSPEVDLLATARQQGIRELADVELAIEADGKVSSTSAQASAGCPGHCGVHLRTASADGARSGQAHPPAVQRRGSQRIGRPPVTAIRAPET
jgi:hypothetical protein